MTISRAAAALLLAACPSLAAARRLQGGDGTFFAADGTPRQGGDGTTPECTLEPIPLNKKDFDEPPNLAFPTWKAPKDGCPRLTELGGELDPDFSAYPEPEEGKFNPCYYTKAFAGLDPMLGGYPTPIDTKYPYEFAAPYMRQPGDGSTHHCAYDAVDVGACPKIGAECGPDCAIISDDYGIGHIPPFVALAESRTATKRCWF